jgi:phage shock protein A
MFDDLRTAFRDAIDNFNKELRRENVSETADRLLVGMRNEITDEKAQVLALEQQIESTASASAREADLGATCRRRERMARDIGDEETAGLAAQQALKHEGHRTVLEKKAEALRDELEFRRKNVDEMIAKFGEAKQQRDALAAKAGRAGARTSFAEADDLFGELDRMAEKIEGERARGDAAEAFGDLDFEGASTTDPRDDFDFRVDLDEPPPPREDVDVDAALAELKRRMGKD